MPASICSKESKTVYLEITSAMALLTDDLKGAIKEVTVESGGTIETVVYHIQRGSIMFRGTLSHICIVLRLNHLL